MAPPDEIRISFNSIIDLHNGEKMSEWFEIKPSFQFYNRSSFIKS